MQSPNYSYASRRLMIAYDNWSKAIVLIDKIIAGKLRISTSVRRKWPSKFSMLLTPSATDAESRRLRYEERCLARGDELGIFV